MATNGQAPTRKREATKKAILDATAELIAEKGVDGFTLSEVAKRGKINRALIYHYFHDREQLIYAAIGHIVQRYDRAEPPRPGADSLEYTARLHIEHPELGKFFFQLLITGQPIPQLPRGITEAIEGLERYKAKHMPDIAYDPPISVITVWLTILTWSFARADMARLLGMSLEEADRRFIETMRNVGADSMRQLGIQID